MKYRLALAAVALLGARPKQSFAPAASPVVRAVPPTITLGETRAVEIQIEIPGRAGAPMLEALGGGHLGEPALVNGVWRASYTPPAATSPSYDVILARTKSGASGLGVVRMNARARLPVAIALEDDAGTPRKPKSVTLTVGPKEYGPVALDAAGKAELDVEIPPGTREVGVAAILDGAAPIFSKEALALPPLARVFADFPPVAKLGKAFDVTLVTLENDGALSRSAPTLTIAGNANAKIASLEEVGPGVFDASIVTDDGAVTVMVKSAGARTRFTVKAPAAVHTVPTPPPLPIETMPPMASIPPSPSCAELKAVPGEITTARALKARISAANVIDDLRARRDGLIALGCEFPDEHSIQLQLAATDLLLGDHESTISVIGPLIADGNEIHDEHLALGLSYRAAAELRLGQLDESVRDATESERHMPGLYSATYTLGEAEFLRKRFPEAMQALLSAYRSAPQFATSLDHVMLAELLERKADPASLNEAVAHRLAGARLDANDAGAWKSAALAAEKAGAWAQAHEAWLVLAAQTMPGLPANAEALSGVSRAKAAAPKDPQVVFIESAIEAERGKNAAKGIFLLQKALEVNPHNLAARYHLALDVFASGNPNRAVLEIGTVLNDAPHWVPALILAGDIDKARGDKGRASDRWREAIGAGGPLAGAAKWRLQELGQVEVAPATPAPTPHGGDTARVETSPHPTPARR